MLSRQTNVRYPETVRVRTPRGMAKAVNAAAAKLHTNPSEFCRQAILNALKAQGLELRAAEAEDRAEG